MKINRIEVQNFKSFEHKTFNFDHQFTLLIGDNGTGKTAILDALAIGAGAWLLGIDERKSRHIRP